MEQRLWQTLCNVQESVRHADGKAIALLAIQGVVITLIVDFVHNYHDTISFNTPAKYLLVIGTLFITLSLLFSFLSLNPRMNKKGIISPIFFGSIAETHDSYDTYWDYLEKNFVADENICQAITEQIYTNSKIAKTKFIWVSRAILTFIVGLGCWAIFIILVL